ncbi:hypothetical protein DPMN_129970 [Dreissena polymorpha]|uniref:protein-tyrosine-phosphatase n=1 Tax=Dreissena polymorpha TaxID=45954 RepID=A0A9D4JXX9_DREPO|nr:hypothetical protein DPMN_129970 [Dreissena polymorpha]
MILQYKVKVVAMACKVVEMGKRKCEEYWPETIEGTIEFGDISVTMISEDVLGENCLIRKLNAQREGFNPVLVTQFHYVGWPDHGIPSDFDIILEMMAEMRKIKRKDADKAPMLIHCSAGCGRTGTICAIDYAWDVLGSGNMDETFDLNQIVKKMREQRPSMIQTPEQYMMAHKLIQTLFKKHLELMEEHTYGNFNFQQDEEEDTIGDTLSVSSSTGQSRKNSVLQQDIENTLKKITLSPHDGPPMEQAPKVPDMLIPTQVWTENKPESKPAVAAVVKPPLPTKPSVDLVSPTTHKTFVFPQETEKSAFRRDKQRSFKVEDISNIPDNSQPPKKVEMRYLESLEKSDSVEKHLSYAPSEAGKQNLTSVKNMFDQPQTNSESGFPPKLSMSFAGTPTEVNHKTDPNLRNSYSNSYTGTNNNSPSDTNQSDLANKRNKFVTKIQIGSASKKPPVVQTVSEPLPTSNPSKDLSKTKTLPLSSTNPFKDIPQASVSPDTSSQLSQGVYSMAQEPYHPYSPISNYSSGAKPQNPYSDVANDSSSPVLNSKQNGNGINPSRPYSFAVEHEKGKTQAGKDYSYAYQDQDSAGGLYTSVEKSEKKKTPIKDAVYESVDLPKKDDPPPIPTRGYEEDNVSLNEKSGANESSSLGTRTKITSAFQKFGNVLSGKSGGGGTQDTVDTSDIPGFGKRIKKKPTGPKDKPKHWFQKLKS